MILICPSCDAQYLLPDNAIGPKGRRVKCTACAYTWLQRPENAPDEEVRPAGKTENDFAGIMEKEARRQALPMITPVAVTEKWIKPVVAGLLLSLVAVALSLGLLIAARDSLTRDFPPLALLYEKTGFAVAVPGEGLDLKEITAHLTPQEKPESLRLQGVIANETGRDQPLAMLLVRASNDKTWLKDWTINLHGKLLPKGKSVGFDYILTDVPENITEVTIRFAE